MSMTQRYAGMLRRHAAEWDKQGLPVQAEATRQAARHMEERERELIAEVARAVEAERAKFPNPVSYTHLTLPTIHVECRSRWSPYH